jgi:hypothetical protein
MIREFLVEIDPVGWALPTIRSIAPFIDRGGRCPPYSKTRQDHSVIATGFLNVKTI